MNGPGSEKDAQIAEQKAVASQASSKQDKEKKKKVSRKVIIEDDRDESASVTSLHNKKERQVRAGA